MIAVDLVTPLRVNLRARSQRDGESNGKKVKKVVVQETSDSEEEVDVEEGSSQKVTKRKGKSTDATEVPVVAKVPEIQSKPKSLRKIDTVHV